MVDPAGELPHVGHDEATQPQAGDHHQHQDMFQASPTLFSYRGGLRWSNLSHLWYTNSITINREEIIRGIGRDWNMVVDPTVFGQQQLGGLFIIY